MAVSSMVFGNTLAKYISGSMDWVSAGADTYKVMLTSDSITPSKEWDFLDDATPGTYRINTDQTVSEVTPTAATGTVTVDVSEASVTYSAVASGTAGGIIVYREVGSSTPADDEVTCMNDFSGGNVTGNGSDITVTFSANGIFTIAY